MFTDGDHVQGWSVRTYTCELVLVRAILERENTTTEENGEQRGRYKCSWSRGWGASAAAPHRLQYASVLCAVRAATHALSGMCVGVVHKCWQQTGAAKRLK